MAVKLKKETSKLLIEEAKHVSRWSRDHTSRVRQGTQGTLTSKQVSRQAMLIRENISKQDTLACKHVSTQGTLACEHVSSQDALARKHVCSTQATQFSRLKLSKRAAQVKEQVFNWCFQKSLEQKPVYPFKPFSTPNFTITRWFCRVTCFFKIVVL